MLWRLFILMKLLLFTLICVGLSGFRDDQDSKTLGNRIANEHVQKPFLGLNPNWVKEVIITFEFVKDEKNIKYRRIHITKRNEIVALIHAFRTSTRDKGRTWEPIEIGEDGDDFSFLLKGGKDSIDFRVYPNPDEIALLWGPELARLHHRYQKRAMQTKPIAWPLD